MPVKLRKQENLLIIRGNAQKDKRFNNRVDKMTGFVTESIVSLPIKNQGKVIGVLEIVNPEENTIFQESFIPYLSILSDFLAISITNANNYKLTKSITYRDDVTGFYNTRFMHYFLEEIFKKGQEVSLVFLDLDDFKNIVDIHGHLIGSKMLKEVADVINSELDEYVVILPDQNKGHALKKINSVSKSLQDSIFLQSEGLSVKITASFGISNYPEDTKTINDLLKSADTSLYKSKEIGKNSITVS